MDDLINRQTAIDELKEHRALYCDNTPDAFSKLSYAEKCRVDELDEAIATLVNLPSVQPEQKTGHWIPILRDSENDEYRCSVCSQPMGFDYDYCPHCGARMTIPTYPSNSIN